MKHFSVLTAGIPPMLNNLQKSIFIRDGQAEIHKNETKKICARASSKFNSVRSMVKALDTELRFLM